MSERFQREVGAFLPGMAAPEQGGQEGGDTGMGMGSMEEVGAVQEETEQELPAFEEKPRPSIDFFKAIFEGSDSDSSDEEEEEEDAGAAAEQGASQQAAAPPAGEEGQPGQAGPCARDTTDITSELP
jgi:hypothetical protein